MKIGQPADKPVNGLASTSPAATTATTANTEAAAAASASAIPTTADDSAKIELSSTATSLLSSNSAEFDADKVASISKAIDDGTFKINPEVIADKLISNAQELLTPFKA